jgi:nucleoside-diphosphate-sugar epimerase
LVEPSRKGYLLRSFWLLGAVDTANVDGKSVAFSFEEAAAARIMKLNVITGATGLLGSHIAEHLVERGDRVRALVRRGSETAFLRSLRVELMEGDLADVDSLRRAFAGAGVVYHCASKVGDWGGWRTFRHEIIDATANVLLACRQEQVGRLLYVSSIMVHGHPPADGPTVTEDSPLAQNLRRWEHYGWSKIEAERLCRQYPRALTILRPSWLYGPRDRTTLPRMIRALKSGRIGLIGDGGHFLNVIYAGDVAEAAILAAESPHAAGQTYNLSSPGEITQREWFDTLAAALGRPPVRKHLPLRLALALGLFSEIVGRLILLKRSPYITRYGVLLATRPTNYSNARAECELGWRLRTPARDGLERSIAWLRQANMLSASKQSPHCRSGSLS